ncbi:carotenoid oxygenase family protein [Allokutzneria sp. NRRL B-24872]|uniref:carotenoid oxygenase family protein n=1 Tax=Allokutzneria sp. NRRL B-24872 TaxID=1137961 RepID=UPI000A3C839F|nr:carotenoid oxygenase family protein [Allokutzneria sp. NRRL B-24872]
MTLAPVDNPYLTGNQGPVDVETTAYDLKITGALPHELDGRYLRIGPNAIGDMDPVHYHPFMASGMVHGLRLRDGQAQWYRNRWVRVPSVTGQLGEAPVLGATTAAHDTANTHVIRHAGKLMAVSEAGALPVVLDEQLATVSYNDFEGKLPHGYAAHSKRDPSTGELFAVTYSAAENGGQLVVVGADGAVTGVERIEIDDKPMIHDTALTANHVVIYDLPVTFNQDAAKLGFYPYVWQDGRRSRIGLMPRYGTNADIRWFEIEPCFVYHTANAYEDGDRVVLEAFRHERVFDSAWWKPLEVAPVLWRWTFDLKAGTVHSGQVDDLAGEFPRIDERMIGANHRYSYGVALHHGEVGNLAGRGIAKHDRVAGTTQVQDFGASRFAGEAVFIPRAKDSAEDDGWLMSLVHDAERDRTDLVVLDAGTLSAEPVAVVHLPVRVPAGFHGEWFPTQD